MNLKSTYELTEYLESNTEVLIFTKSSICAGVRHYVAYKYLQ